MKIFKKFGKLPAEDYCYQATDFVEVDWTSVLEIYVADARQELWDSSFVQKCIDTSNFTKRKPTSI